MPNVTSYQLVKLVTVKRLDNCTLRLVSMQNLMRLDWGRDKDCIVNNNNIIIIIIIIQTSYAPKPLNNLSFHLPFQVHPEKHSEAIRITNKHPPAKGQRIFMLFFSSFLSCSAGSGFEL